MSWRGAIYLGSRKVWSGPVRPDAATANADAQKASNMYPAQHAATGAPRKKRVGVIRVGRDNDARDEDAATRKNINARHMAYHGK